MIETAQVIEHLMNDLGRGLVYIDSQRCIGLYNQKAKFLTGIDFDCTNTHEEGKIVPGDIVILADNNLGDDDGGLTVEDLTVLNVRDSAIQKQDMVIVVGVYQDKCTAPVYKYMREHRLQTPFALDTSYFGFEIHAVIDSVENQIRITVDDMVFSMKFFQSIGHMVVIDGKSGRIKFFQMPGYSVRKESPALLLKGGTFLAKAAEEGNTYSVVGQPMTEVFEQSELTCKIEQVLQGEAEAVQDTLYEVNRRPFICSIIPHKGGDEKKELVGVFLILQDAWQLEHMMMKRNRILEQVEKQKKVYQQEENNFPDHAFLDLIGSGAGIQQVKYLAYKASQTKFNVMLTGESGTGKSQLAREIHRLQNEKAPYVEVNCNAIAPSLFESELFGYVAGAFTGAVSKGKTGYFQRASGGTIFLDEIGELPLDIQVKLLQVLQSKTIYPVGSSKPVLVDVRVIAATNKNLEEEVEQGRFRRDLFYRINVFPIEIPPLRQRKSDLHLLINHILQQLCQRYGVSQKQLSSEALQKMLSYDWPGNVRELENTIERGVTLCQSNLIYPEHINLPAIKKSKTMKELLQEEEKRILQEALLRYHGDKRSVMEELHISKSVFYDKCKKYEI